MTNDKRKYADRAEYLKAAVTRRRRALRKKAVEYKGSQCEICGYNRYHGALDFHHIDESQKKFGISAKGITRSWNKIQTEIDKCILLCANCHRELHGGMLQLPSEMMVENRVNCGKPKVQ